MTDRTITTFAALDAPTPAQLIKDAAENDRDLYDLNAATEQLTDVVLSRLPEEVTLDGDRLIGDPEAFSDLEPLAQAVEIPYEVVGQVLEANRKQGAAVSGILYVNSDNKITSFHLASGEPAEADEEHTLRQRFSAPKTVAEVTDALLKQGWVVQGNIDVEARIPDPELMGDGDMVDITVVPLQGR